MKKNENQGKQGEKKIRKLYHLDPEDALFVRERAQSKRVSESEVIREAVRALQGETKADPFQKLIGNVKARSGDAAAHDEVIYE